MAAVHAAPGSTKLADHAATAALYVTNPERKRAEQDARESERRTAASTVPPGLTLASASAAASLAHSHQKPVDLWKPEKQPHAEKAAMLAKGYQEPEHVATSNISPEVYKAAVSAAKERVYSSTPPPQFSQLQGRELSAAARTALNQDNGAAKIHPGALNAATGAVSSRRRADSAPIKPLQNPAAAYALSAATISHQNSQAQPVLENLDPALEAARIHHVARFNAQMYTSSPPVDIEVAEQKQKDTLRAAAISMAKDMYAKASIKEESSEGVEAARSATQNRHSHRRSESQYSWTAGDEATTAPRPYVNLHEAAQKIAAEKLAKMRQNDQALYQQYYGTAPHPRSRVSIVGKLRRRTSSESDASSLDRERSMEIRNQMSSLQSRLHEVDERKSRDRAGLMEIARKNVTATIHNMDEKVYARTGKPSPSMQREWEEKAHERAKAESEARMSNFGKVNIGGQKYMDEVDVEAIARARIQPTLDDINDRAEEKRARELEMKLDLERRQTLQEQEHQREQDIKMEQKRQKAADKQALKEEKASATDRKRVEKSETSGRWSKIFKGSKHNEEEDRQKPARDSETTQDLGGEEAHDEDLAERDHPEETVVPATASQDAEAEESQPPVAHPVLSTALVMGTATGGVQTSIAANPPKGDSKFRGWFKPRSSKPHISKPTAVDPASVPVDAATTDGGDRTAPLASNPVTDQDLVVSPVEPGSISTNGSKRSDNRRSRFRMSFSKMLARKSPEERKSLEERKSPEETGDSAVVSPLESPTTPTRGRDLATSRTNTEEREEKRDQFEEEALAPPPQLPQIIARGSASPGRDSKFSEDL